MAQQVQNVLFVFTHGGAQMIYEVMENSDMIAALKDPHACVGTDSRVWTSEMTTSHPRSIGNFPKILGELVRGRDITLDEALRKMTLEPAVIFGLSDRGRLQEGMPADLIVFDPDTVSGPADYNRLQDPVGIDYVLVNGVVVSKFGRVQDRFAGKVIRKRNENPLNIVAEPPASLEYPKAKTNPVSVEKRRKMSKAAPPRHKAVKRGTGLHQK